MSEAPIERPIVVTAHAVEAFSRRRQDHRSWNVLEAEIRACVEEGLRAGLVFNHRPPGFVLYRRKNANLPDGQRFVLCDRDAEYGFILKEDPEEGDVVVTTLTRAGVRR